MPAPRSGQPVVQRVIAGLEAYQDPAHIPREWLDTYHRDLLDAQAFLSEDQVWNVFNRVVGPGMPYNYGIAINHVGGNHWTLRYKEVDYQVVGDGSCGLHAVHLAHSLLNGATVDPKVAYKAPADFVNQQRQALYNNLVHADNAAQSNREAARHISLAITNTEHVFETGFGTDMQRLLQETVIRSNRENLNRFLDIGYANYWAQRKKAINDLPKPSEARKIYQTDEFHRLAQGRASLNEVLTLAISQVHQRHNFSVAIDFSQPDFQGEITKSARSAGKSFRSPAAVKKEMEAFKTAYKLKSPKKKRLRGGGKSFLSKEERVALRKKMRSPGFRKKVMLASRQAVLKFRKTGTEKGSITKMISEGSLDFKSVNMSSAQVLEALHAFTSSKTTGKSDLALGSGKASYTSIGQGGLQVKGLETYPEETRWFQQRITKWKVSPADLFRALMTRNEDELQRLTRANKTEMKHMLSFRVLQLEEIFRGMQFGIGVAAHLNLGFHGQSDIGNYLYNMPMYAGGATTNVTQTQDWNAPHDPSLWSQQEQSTMNGIQQLAEMDMEAGQMYNMHAQNFLQQLHAEPEEGEEPTGELVDQSYQFMMSPNPYINEDEDDGGEKKI
ncbi:hypothetical protein GCM10009415_50640 [Chitinophaga japonensis]